MTTTTMIDTMGLLSAVCVSLDLMSVVASRHRPTM
jgi:hypothetical protein